MNPTDIDTDLQTTPFDIPLDMIEDLSNSPTPPVCNIIECCSTILQTIDVASQECENMYARSSMVIRTFENMVEVLGNEILCSLANAQDDSAYVFAEDVRQQADRVLIQCSALPGSDPEELLANVLDASPQIQLAASCVEDAAEAQAFQRPSLLIRAAGALRQARGSYLHNRALWMHESARLQWLSNQVEAYARAHPDRYAPVPSREQRKVFARMCC